ncbi:MAG: leucine-rich repeat protein [Oscillospiraceae bacterium]|nr:leucine-rich repeat protein [Oscillospiraceae bacterium]MBR0311855.1 leucine-rich repeat protein [Oscillospiraceae bacterium]
MKRFLALFLCFALCLTLLPAASAEDIEIVDPAGADVPGGPTDELVIDEPVEADAPGGQSDEPLIEPVEADAPGGPTDELVIDPVGADAPGGPLDEIALVDEPETVAPGADEIQATIGSGDCGDNLTWSLNSDGYLFISGSGPMTDFTRGTAPWYEYRTQIKELYVYGGTTIGDYAFVGCSNLTLPADNGKSFPSTLTSIGKCAFLSCNSLEYVTIPSGVTSIGNQAFDYCNGLKRVTVCGAPTLGSWAFGDCPALEEISFLGGVPTFSEKTFDGSHAATAWYPPDKSAWTSDVLQNYGGTLTWQAGYHGWIGDDITWDLNASTGVLSLSGSGTNWWFGSAGKQSWLPIRSKVKTASVGSGITVLDEYALSNLYNMTSVSLPDTLTEIGYEVFLGDSSLTSITIPKSVTKLGYMIFNNCSALKEVRFLGHAPESINAKAFSGVTATVYYYPVYTWTTDNRLNYGGTLTWTKDDKVGASATWRLSDSGILTIGGTGATNDYPSDYPAFYGFRDEVTYIYVSRKITSLGVYLFYGMNKAEKIRIMDDVTSIGKSCFSGCRAAKEIFFVGAAPSFGENCFNNVTATAYYMPVSSTQSSWTSDVMQNYGGTITWKCDNQVGDNVTWSLNDSTGVLSLSGTGPTWDIDNGNASFYYFPVSTIKSIVVGSGVTTLGAFLFTGLAGATSVSLPTTLTEIGVQTFVNCYSLTSVTIPKNVTTINWSAFHGCTGLKEIRFLGHAPTIASNAFSGVTATVYYYPVYTWTTDTMQQYGGTLTWSCDNKVGTNAYWMLYESGALTIGGAASGFATDDFPSEYPNFYGFRDEITSATISEKCTRAGNYLFYDLNKLEKVTISGQTDLGNHCFGRCTALKEIRFCDKAPTISASAFNAVTATAYYLPIVDGGWSSDVTQNYGGTITWVCDSQVGPNVFWSIDASGTLTLTGTGPTWDYSTSSLPGYYYISLSVKSLTVGEGITTIGKNLFEDLDQLTSVSLPDTLTTISSTAFASCGVLSSITIPKSVTTIGASAFSNCKKLTEVRFLGHAPTIASTAFNNVTATVYYFPVYSWTEDKLQQYSGTLTWVCDDKIGDDVTWYLAENGKLSITGTGATWDFNAEPNFNYFRSEIKTAEITAGVTGLGKFLLWGWSTDALEIVVVGPDVATIGANAFSWCTKLTEIRFQGEAPSFGNNCFYNVTATAYYPADDPTWTEDVMQDYGGHITWVPYGGYSITVANYTKGKATTSLVPGLLYSGVITFTVSCDQAAVVAVKNGDEYTRLKCTTVGDEHRYTLIVGDNVEIAVALKGDANLDGAVKSSEATMIKRAIAGTYQFKNGFAALAADVNGDGEVKASDATMLARFIAGTYTIKW